MGAAMRRDIIRVGIVGVGGMGAGHCTGLQAIPELRLAGVADIRPARAEEIGRQFGVPWFTDHRALLRAGGCDLVMVATPHPEHLVPVLDSLRAGLPVFCEKPLTERIGTARRMVRAAARARRALAVNFPIRFRPSFRAAVEWVRAGHLGTLYRALLTAPLFRTQAYYAANAWRATWQGEGGGVLLNQAPHLLDAFLLLTGAPRRVFGLTRTRWHRIETEDHAEALLEFAGGATGYLVLNTNEPETGGVMELVGSKGRLVLRGNAIEASVFEHPLTECIRRSGKEWGKPVIRPVTLPVAESAAVGSLPWRNVAAHLRDGEPLVSPGAGGLLSLEVANAIALSAALGRWVGLPLSAARYDRFLAGKRRGIRGRSA